jgi:hypothetical protein
MIGYDRNAEARQLNKAMGAASTSSAPLRRTTLSVSRTRVI